MTKKKEIPTLILYCTLLRTTFKKCQSLSFSLCEKIQNTVHVHKVSAPSKQLQMFLFSILIKSL